MTICFSISKKRAGPCISGKRDQESTSKRQESTRHSDMIIFCITSRAHQLCGHCQGYCRKLSKKELWCFAVVAVSWPKSRSHSVSQPCSINSAQGCSVLLRDSFPGKSADYLINCKTLLKMRMFSGDWENNKIIPFPSLLIYGVLIITGKTSWWVAHIESLPMWASADLDTSITNKVWYDIFLSCAAATAEELWLITIF